MNDILYIICPCYNEEENLENGYTFDKLEEVMAELIAEKLCSPKSRILMVNDGSSDRTEELLKKKHEQNALFSYLSLSKNFGHQYALLSGLMSVREVADVTITIDADLQQDIGAIKEFLLKFQEGFQIVYGVRTSRDTDGFFKRASASVFYTVMQKFGGVNIIRNHADYRLMSKKALNALAEFEETNLFLRGLVPMLGFKSCIVYFTVHEREYGTSKYTLKKMVTLAADGITSCSTRPIRVVFFLGLFISIVSILIAFAYFIAWLLGKTISGWTSVVMSIWILGGLTMLSLGCIGEYIGKMYLEAKKRPRYIIDELENDVDYEYMGDK
ncbi:MAG: glycosyltransferase family 2 protein [Lachnospiraceae bacterium]|nr:glycosyltransferase family 2 protein [Lachnospiraceae bacterium]